MATRVGSPFNFPGIFTQKCSQLPKERGIYAKVPSPGGWVHREPAHDPPPYDGSGSSFHTTRHETRRVDQVQGTMRSLEQQEKPMAACSHVKDHVKNVKPSSKGCEDCLKTGDSWVHLRMCLECGHVGCCDSSKNRHARAHFHGTQHPIIKSAERGENWRWCYVDDTYLD